jgi:aminopeptidase N
MLARTMPPAAPASRATAAADAAPPGDRPEPAARFLLAWSMPLAVGGAACFSPAAAWGTMFGFQVALALLERVPALARAPAAAAAPAALHRVVLRGHVVLQAALLALAVGLVVARDPGWLAVVALAIGVGGVTGSQGITFAHELGHSRARIDRALAWGLMASVLYAHFMVEHYRGHHVRAATPDDPASARRGESLWRFLPRTLAGSFASAWRLEAAHLARRHARWRHSALAWVSVAQGLGLVALAAAFGPKALLFWLVQAAYAVFLLEAINYIEHYGLVRAKVASGTGSARRGHGGGAPHEPFGTAHAWNADARVTNLFIANLQRHGDHHVHAWKPYPALDALPAPAPQLPTGYAGCLFLASVPRWWFRVMHRRLDALAAAPSHAAMLALAAVLAGALAATVPAPALAQAPTFTVPPRYDFRATPTALPKDVLPEQVSVRLMLDPDRSTFEGEATIRVRVLQRTPSITLHAVELAAESAQLVPPAGGAGAARTLRVEADAARGTWRLVPADAAPIEPGEHRLALRWQGRVMPSGQGLYRADHRVQGRAARLLATQFQATQARRMLPVFDEPVFRTSFEVSVRAPAGFEVLSNMPLVQKQPEGAAVWHRFAPTPPMPSYLLAVAVGRFDVLEGRSGETPLRIFTAPGKREQARFALTSTQQLLPWMAAYFGRPYSLPKLDQLAVPGTRQGAMEDWGLVSYVEDLLLWDPAKSDAEQQRWVFETIAHELAHQWFGNLVSVASWNEIWLNEAFATWLAAKATRHFHPQWQTGLRQRDALDRVLARDATAATRAIRSGPVREQAVFDVFDDITYDKGGAVLSMLEQWIGEDTFRRGLASYIAERAERPATAGDLWHHIGQLAALPVGAVATSWTDQPGLPLVTASMRCTSGRTVIELAQRRFSLGEPLAGGPWKVPLRFAAVGAPAAATRTVLLDAREGRAEWPGCEAPVVVNAGGLGFLRVEYDAASRARLVAAFEQLGAADRIAFASDGFALALAGRVPMAEHLALLARAGAVADTGRPALLGMATTHWTRLDEALAGSPAHEALRRAGHALFAPELTRLGWRAAREEPAADARLRAQLVRVLARLDHPPTVREAQGRLLGALQSDVAVAPPSLRGAILEAVGRHADAAEFDALLGALRSAPSEEERWLLAGALAQGRDPARAQRLLEESLAGSLPPNIASAVPALVGATPGMAPLAYGFAVKHFAALAKLAGDGLFGGRQLILPGSTGASADAGLAARMLADQARLAGPDGASAAATAAAAIKVRAALREREGQRLAMPRARVALAPA